MKMPELPKRKPSVSAGGRGGIKTPAFVADLFKDMRDRRLIIPAIALLVAIVAVPMLLASKPEPVVPAQPPVVDSGAGAFEPGVLAVEEVAVRDFRERLDALERNNPFRERFAPPAVDLGETAGELVEPDNGDGATGGAAGGEAPAGGTLSEEAPVGGTSDVPEPTTPPGGGEPYVLVSRINVEVGIVGREQKETIENVEAGDLLPGKQAPTALFLGNTDDSEFAELLVSRDVTKVTGDGRCKPERKCEFLRLADGERAYLSYQDGKRYSIRVTDIYFVKVDQEDFDAKD